MSKAVEVITSVERRRRWGGAEKERLVAASLEPGGSVSAVARSAGIHPSQLYGWRRQLVRRSQPAPTFAAVQIGCEPIARGRAGPLLLAHILFAKYGLHLPLNRQSATYAREGIPLDVSTLADWVAEIKIAARVIELSSISRAFNIQLPTNCPEAALF